MKCMEQLDDIKRTQDYFQHDDATCHTSHKNQFT